MTAFYSGLVAAFTAFGLQGVLLGAAALALLAAAPWLQKRYGAAWLCRLWLVLAVCFLVPVRLLLPGLPRPIQVPVPPAITQPVTTPQNAPAITPPSVPAAPAPAVQAAGTATAPQTPTALPAWAPWTPLEWLALLWLAGVVCIALWQWGGYCIWKRTVLHRAQKPRAGWRSAWQSALAGQGTKRPPRLLASPDVGGPLLLGLWRPTLLVPCGEAPSGAVYMLTHELCHLRRQDIARKAVLMLACAVHWYDPAVWLLARRAAADIETACDAAAVRRRGTAWRDAYAAALLEAVRLRRGPILSTGFVLTKRELQARLQALWAKTPRRRGRLALAAAALTAAALGALAACTAQAPNADTELASPTPSPAPQATASPLPEPTLAALAEGPTEEPTAQPTPAADSVPAAPAGTVWIAAPQMDRQGVQPIAYERPTGAAIGTEADYNQLNGMLTEDGLACFWVPSAAGGWPRCGIVDAAGNTIIEPVFSNAGCGYGGRYYGIVSDEGLSLPPGSYELVRGDDGWQVQSLSDREALAITGTNVNLQPCWAAAEQAIYEGFENYYIDEQTPVPAVRGPLAMLCLTHVREDFAVEVEDVLGRILSDGQRPVSDVIYEEAGAYSCGIVPVRLNGKWGYADESGALVIPCEYDASWARWSYTGERTTCYPATESTVVLCRGGQFALCALDGREIIPFGACEELCPVQNGRLWAKVDGRWGLLALAG